LKIVLISFLSCVFVVICVYLTLHARSLLKGIKTTIQQKALKYARLATW